MFILQKEPQSTIFHFISIYMRVFVVWFCQHLILCTNCKRLKMTKLMITFFLTLPGFVFFSRACNIVFCPLINTSYSYSYKVDNVGWMADEPKKNGCNTQTLPRFNNIVNSIICVNDCWKKREKCVRLRRDRAVKVFLWITKERPGLCYDMTKSNNE